MSPPHKKRLFPSQFSCFFSGFLTWTSKGAKRLFELLFFKAAFKILAVFRCSLCFQTRGPAASKTLGAGQRRPLSISTPQSTSLIVYESLLLLGCVQKQEKTQEPGCAKASRVKGVGGLRRWAAGAGGGGMKGRNSCHSPLVFSRFLKRQLPRPCE